MPEMFDNNSIEQWQADGAIETNERSLIRARQLLDEYEEPKLDEGINDALARLHCTARARNTRR